MTASSCSSRSSSPSLAVARLLRRSSPGSRRRRAVRSVKYDRRCFFASSAAALSPTPTVIMAIAQRRRSARSAAGMSSNSQIVVRGRRAERWRTRSAGAPLSAMSSSSPSTVRCVVARSRSTCRLVKAAATSRRSLLCSGGSIRLIASAWAMGAGVIRGRSRPIPAARLKRRSEVTRRTSSYLVTSQASPSPYGMRMRAMGASVSSRLSSGSNSRPSAWSKGQCQTSATELMEGSKLMGTSHIDPAPRPGKPAFSPVARTAHTADPFGPTEREGSTESGITGRVDAVWCGNSPSIRERWVRSSCTNCRPARARTAVARCPCHGPAESVPPRAPLPV